jgi:hypothetical protein
MKYILFGIKTKIIILLTVMTSLLLFIEVLPSFKNDFKQEILLLLVQGIVIPMIAWWGSYFFYDYYNLNGDTILKSLYSKKVFKILSFRFFIFISVFLLFFIFLYINGYIVHPLSSLLLFISQLFFVYLTSIFLSLLFRDTDIALLIIILYITTEVVTSGTFPTGINIFYFNDINSIEESLNISISNIICAMPMIILSKKLY